MYRVSDSDRERATALLRRCYAEGRLTVEELAERAERLAKARTTAELRAGLRDLPSSRAVASIAPRLNALRQTPSGEAVSRRVARAKFGGSLFVAWFCVSIAMLAALSILRAFAGESDLTTLIFLLAWTALTWVAWRIWRRGARPS